MNVCYRESLLSETKSRRKNQAFGHANNNKFPLNLFNLKMLFYFDSVICQFPKEKVESEIVRLIPIKSSRENIEKTTDVFELLTICNYPNQVNPTDYKTSLIKV